MSVLPRGPAFQLAMNVAVLMDSNDTNRTTVRIAAIMKAYLNILNPAALNIDCSVISAKNPVPTSRNIIGFAARPSENTVSRM